jgi:hypothetical protein
MTSTMILYLVFGRTYKTKTLEYDKNLQKHLKRKMCVLLTKVPPLSIL